MTRVVLKVVLELYEGVDKEEFMEVYPSVLEHEAGIGEEYGHGHEVISVEEINE